MASFVPFGASYSPIFSHHHKPAAEISHAENFCAPSSLISGSLGDAHGVEAMIEGLGHYNKPFGHANWHESKSAAEVLGEIGDPRAIPALVNFLGIRGKDTWHLRLAAGESLLAILSKAPSAISYKPLNLKQRIGAPHEDLHHDHRGDFRSRDDDPGWDHQDHADQHKDVGIGLAIPPKLQNTDF